MKKLIPILVLLLAISLAFCDVRLTGLSLRYLPGDLGAGYPRLAEVIAILMIGAFFTIGIKNRTVNAKLRSGILSFTLCCFLMIAFALFKPFYNNYLRSACVIPSLLFLATMRLEITDKLLFNLFKIIYCVISFSAIFVIISPYVDLGVTTYYIDSANADAQRYIGFGTSLPYQACFNICSIPLFFYLIEKETSKIWNALLVVLLVLNVLAVFLTGARTAYVICIILALYYYKYWRKYIKVWSVALIVVICICAFYYVGDSVSMIWDYRHGTDLSQRDVVWLIGLQLILSHPLLGIQNYFVEGREFGHVVAHVQNGFFEIAFWGGLIALILYLYSFFRFYKSVKLYNDINHCFVGIVLVYFVFMLAEILFYSVQDYFLILLIIGLLIANYQTRIRCS